MAWGASEHGHQSGRRSGRPSIRQASVAVRLPQNGGNYNWGGADEGGSSED